MLYTISDQWERDKLLIRKGTRMEAIDAICEARDLNTYTATAILDKADGLRGDWPNPNFNYGLTIESETT